VGAKYSGSQYGGAATILLGVVIVMIPQFTGSSSGDNSPLFNCIFLLANIPSALSSVYKEVAFRNDDIDVNYLQAWVAIWQLLFGLFLIPLNTLDFLGANTLRWDELLDALVKGARCLGGYNSVVPPNCWLPPHRVEGMNACDNCHLAWMPVVTYLTFNCLFNIFIVMVIKHGGAALMYVVMTLRLPLVQFAFSLSFINNPPDTFGWPAIVGLFVILTGLITYRYSSAVKRPVSAEEEEVMVFTFGQSELPAPIRRKRMLHAMGTRLRNDLARKLGVIPSPITPHSPRSRTGTPRLKGGAIGESSRSTVHSSVP